MVTQFIAVIYTSGPQPWASRSLHHHLCWPGFLGVEVQEHLEAQGWRPLIYTIELLKAGGVNYLTNDAGDATIFPPSCSIADYRRPRTKHLACLMFYP